MAKKRIAHKLRLDVDEAGGVNFTQIANIRRIGDPSYAREAVDVTCMDSDIDEGRPSPVLALGDLTLQVYWDEADTDHQRFITMVTGTQPVEAANDPAWRITFPFATPIERTIRGWVKELGEAPYEVKGEIVRDVTIHVTAIPANA